ncbi:MAG: MlaD family protein [Flavobacteriaceae bacterium]|jgi:phospholipid/cholesterol/gamma-HCH transport system substrate-binding protein|nr:MlaD family protein [Flavobacteriaceae bacterium]
MNLLRLTKEIKAGLIVVLGITAVILGFSYLKSNSLLGKSTKLYAVYDHVGGLQSGTAVSLNGFSVGTIDDITFLDETGKLMVSFTLITDLPIPTDSKAELYDTSVLGGKGLQIILGTPGSAIAQSGDTLTSIVKIGMTDRITELMEPLEAKVNSAIVETDLLMKNLNQLLDADSQALLRETLNNFSETSASLKVISQNVSENLTANEKVLGTILENTAELTSNLSSVSQTLNEADLKGLMVDLNESISATKEILAGINNGEGTVGQIFTNQELYVSLTSNLNQLEWLLQDLRLNPKRYLSVSVFGKKQKDYVAPESDPAKNSKNQ